MRLPPALVAFALLLAAPATALASSPCACGLGITPLHGDVKDFPTNGRLFIQAGTPRAALSLVKVVAAAPAEDVPFHFEDLAGGTGDAWLVPDAPLEPNTGYAWGHGNLKSPFITGAGPDTEAPTFTSAIIQGSAMDGACEEHLAATFVIDGPADNTAPFTNWFIQINLESPARTIYLSPVNEFYFGRMTTDEPGWENCLNNVPEAEEGKTFPANLVAFDWAGNASKTATNSFQFEAGGSSGCGCEVVGSRSEGGAAFAAIAAALAFMRSRRRLPR